MDANLIDKFGNVPMRFIDNLIERNKFTHIIVRLHEKV
jgi:hypothetical protein